MQKFKNFLTSKSNMRLRKKQKGIFLTKNVPRYSKKVIAYL